MNKVGDPPDSVPCSSDHTLKFLIINCQSIRSQNKRNELGVLLLHYDIDIVLGNESHIDSTFLSSEILPASYKLIRRDRSLGGGGVFIGFRNDIIISELLDLSSEAEMLWARLQILNSKPMYLCSFYRPPNNDAAAIAALNTFLSDIFHKDSSKSPQILLAGDFNLPSISWTDGIGQINPNPTYGTNVNQLLLESINEFGLDQMVTEPTRGENTLDLIFSSHPESTSNIKVIPGISDHEAVYCELKLTNRLESDNIEHPVFLYNRGNMTQLKTDILDFQTEFLSSDPYSNNVQENWESFKQAITNAINKNIPQTMSRASKELPWINHNIKRQMKQRKKLYNKAKHLQTEEAWRDYRNIKNNITMLIRESHRKYQNKMFSDDGGINYKKFWRYVKTIRRDIHGIAPLKVENSFVYHSEDQAEISP